MCVCEGVGDCFLHFYTVSPIALLLPVVCQCQIKKVTLIHMNYLGNVGV